jgi:hypothetical protein
MLKTEIADQVRAEVRQMKQAGEQFLETYRQLCAAHGAPKWPSGNIEMVFHRVRSEIIPVMEEAGMDANSVESLCTWAEKRVMQR